MADKKPNDYTNSAVNLCNPPEVADLVESLVSLKARRAIFENELLETDLYKKLKAKETEIAKCNEQIRLTVEEKGSFQDLDRQLYAIKQRKLSVTYVVSKVREFIRTYADAVIEETVSRSKLEGLRKGGLVSQTDLDRCADTTESFAFFIKTPEGG